MAIMQGMGCSKVNTMNFPNFSYFYLVTMETTYLNVNLPENIVES